MKKTLTLLLSGLLLAGMATAASAWEENVDYAVVGEITAANYPASASEGWPTCPTGQLLKGTIITGIVGETTCRDGHSADLAFDGDPNTYFGTFEQSTRSFVGIVLDQAYELTEIRARLAEDVPTDNFHGLSVQGSNDGIHWEDIVDFRQDATGKTYHIFTPQTVTDEAYAAAGYKAATDESPFWVGSGNSYKMYRVWTHALQLSLGEIEFYGNPAPETVLDDEAAAALIATTTWFPGNINVRNVTIESIDGSLVGKVVGAAGSWNKAFYENAFDGNNKRAYDPSFRGPENWVGLWLDEPHALKSFKVMPKRGAYANLEGCLIQGSLDGRTWVTLCQLTAEDVPTKQVWIEKEVNDTNGYYYFRYVTNIRSHGDIADILFYGEPAAAATDVPAAEKYPVATYEKFLGTMIDTGIRSTSTDGSLVGTVMGYGDIWFLNRDYEKTPSDITKNNSYEAAFDGNLSTLVSFEKLGPGYFTALKLDAPTVITEAKLYISESHALKNVSGAHLQGSVDGINWVDLAVFTDADIPAAASWLSRTVTDTTAYSYVRYAPSSYAGDPMAEVAFFGTAAPTETEAPETAAPETQAPETAAPETAAPETQAPETAAPETAAPETQAPETAAPETNAPVVEPQVSDEFHFYGELVNTGARNVIPAGIENAVSGTIYGAGGTPDGFDYAKAFDGTLTTWWAANENRWDSYMIVLKADAPVAAQSFVIAAQDSNADGISERRHCIIGSRIQGSNDGINWTTLHTVVEDDYLDYLEQDGTEEGSWITLSSDDTTTKYTYFRYVNNDDGAASIAEFIVVGPEAQAPATFDAGVIAAVAAVVSAAGYAISKKRK